jgi:hypothetical protein
MMAPSWQLTVVLQGQMCFFQLIDSGAHWTSKESSKRIIKRIIQRD